jgi:hypothetical protein
MKAMLLRRDLRFVVIAAVIALAASITLSAQSTTHRGRKYKAPPQTSRIEVTILRDSDAKPIENASVIFHLDGDKGNMELKTNEDGKTVIDVLPIGSQVRVQVIAKGYQTYGEDYKVDKAALAFGIRLKRPGEQYSVYKHQSDTADAEKDPAKDGAGKDAESKDTAKAPDKPANPQAGQSQPSPQPQLR